MKQLKNKVLIKVNRKLIFIISILMIVALNLFGEFKEKIEFEYYYYTNKLYHSTLKTEIIPSEYVFITTSSNKDYSRIKNENLYLYNLKTKEKKLFYTYKFYINDSSYHVEDREYYDIKGNLTTNWTDTNMHANGLYEITNNRFGETIYYNKGIEVNEYSLFVKGDNYIQKAYKYSLTQPEIINKKDRGIYLFRGHISSTGYFSLLCLQNEYYIYYHREEDLLNYDAKGRVIFNSPVYLKFSYIRYNNNIRRWQTWSSSGSLLYTNTIYFKLNDKTLIKPTWNEFNNNSLDFIKQYAKDIGSYRNGTNFHYSKEDTERNTIEYKKVIDIDYIGFIPIEEFEYYLLED